MPEEDEDVPGFWRALGLPGLADVHVHFLPPRLLRRVWQYFDEAGPLVGVSWPIRYKWSDAERVPVVVHAGHAPVGTDNTGPGPFGSLMARYPDLTAIVGHLGAPDYGPFLRMAADYERVALDTTMVFTGFFDKLAPFPAGALPLARELGVAGKILLGSDFPNLPYPYARQLAGLAGIGLGEDWLRAVCWDNPVAMFGLPEAVGGG